MERNITITLKKAREWYNGDNKSLREVALQAFTEEEYDKKTRSQLVKETVHEFKNIIEQLKENGKDISKLPLNCLENLISENIEKEEEEI